jgi:hypothetical protein
MRTYKSQSTIRPQEWDVASSSTTVYHNKNITKSEKDGKIVYEYDVEHFDIAEAAPYIALKMESAISEQDNAIIELMYQKTLLELEIQG